jgi:CBS domain-containing protein
MKLDAPITSIMTPDVESVSPDQKIIDIKHIYERPDFHSHIPVMSEGKVTGIISLVNFMHAIHDATLDDSEEVYHEILVRNIMTPNPTSIPSGASIRDAVEILSKGEFHSILVADEGDLKGIVTSTDILRQLLA